MNFKVQDVYNQIMRVTAKCEKETGCAKLEPIA